MPWNPSDDNKRVTPRRGGVRGNSGGKRGPAWRQLWQAGPRARATLYAAAAGFIAVLWLASGCYQLEASERGVLQRFGAYAGERGSGFGWHLPWPIETLTVVDLGAPNSAAFQARMLTSDGMLVNVTGDIPYRFADARAAMFADRDPDALLHDLGEALARAAVAQRPIAALMDQAKRAPLSAGLASELQRLLDSIGAGLRVQGVNLADVQVPEPVLPAQRDLVLAGRDNERVVREAQSYAAELIPSAQQLARKQRLDAESGKLEMIGAAEADAARFGPLAAAYARAPAATRRELYVETMEAILANSRKVIVDGKGINTLLLPLDRLGDAAALKAAGVIGIARADAAAAGTGPAAAAANGTAAADGTAAGKAPAADQRSRERESRQ